MKVLIKGIMFIFLFIFYLGLLSAASEIVIDCNDEQFMNAQPAIWATESGMVMDVRDEQSQKVQYAIDVIEAGY